MTKEDRNEWITNNMPLVYSTLSMYRKWHNYEDIVQQGVLGAIDALDRHKDDNINTSYICKYIKGYAKRYATRADAQMHRSIRSGTYEIVGCLSLNATVNTVDSSSCEYGELLEGQKDFVDDLIAMCDFENMINQLSERTRRPILCLAKGYGVNDSAQICGISYQRVQQIKKQCNRALVTA